jgi:hypothetical protein
LAIFTNEKKRKILSTLSCYRQLWQFLAICFFIEEFKKRKKKESATGYLLLLLLLFTKRRKFTTIYFTEYREVKITYKIIIIVRCDLNLDPGLVGGRNSTPLHSTLNCRFRSEIW